MVKEIEITNEIWCKLRDGHDIGRVEWHMPPRVGETFTLSYISQDNRSVVLQNARTEIKCPPEYVRVNIDELAREFREEERIMKEKADYDAYLKNSDWYSLRHKYAGMVMQSLLQTDTQSSFDKIAENAVLMADLMINNLKKSKYDKGGNTESL